MYIHRQLEEEIAPFLKRKEALAIIGPRQSGKTTFLRYLENELKKKKKVKFLSFEKREDLNLFEESIEEFKDLYQDFNVLIIDEFHYTKEGGQKLKYLYDTSKFKLIISGSSSLELTFKTGKYMVGRLLTFRLYPFSFQEYLSFAEPDLFKLIKRRFWNFSFLGYPGQKPFSSVINQRLEKSFENYLLWGGYPAVVLSKKEIEKRKILAGILETYLLRDIKDLLSLATEDSLIKLVRFLATQIGNLINFQELSKISQLNYLSLTKHLNILEQTYIIELIKPYFVNPRTELVKNPKVYFSDLGLRNLLLEDFGPIDKRVDQGALIENFVFNSLKRISPSFEKINYWRTKSKAEVDFTLRYKNEIVPIEVKYQKNPVIGKSLYSFIEKYSPKEAFILTKEGFKEKKIKKSKVHFLPVYYLP